MCGYWSLEEAADEGVELPPDVEVSTKFCEAQMLTNYFQNRRFQMDSQILLMNVKFQDMKPLVRQMIQYSHGIAFL